MKTLKLFVFAVLTQSLFLSCNELPTFENEGINDPTSSDYIVHEIDQFEIIRNFSNNTASFFIKYTKQFPYDGFLIEHRETNSGEDFSQYQIVEYDKIINDSLYYVPVGDLPVRFNEFKIRAYIDVSGDRIYSQPLYSILNQQIFQFRKVSIANDSTDNDIQLNWQQNFISGSTSYDIYFYLYGINDEERVIKTSINSTTSYLNIYDTGMPEIRNIEYAILQPHENISESTLRHPFFVNVIDCIETREGYQTFRPNASMTYDYSAKRIEYSWSTNCGIDEVQIVRDDGGIYRTENQPWPNIVVESKKITTGSISKVIERNKRNSFTQLRLRAVIDSSIIESGVSFYVYL